MRCKYEVEYRLKSCLHTDDKSKTNYQFDKLCVPFSLCAEIHIFSFEKISKNHTEGSAKESVSVFNAGCKIMLVNIRREIVKLYVENESKRKGLKISYYG